MGVLLGLSVLGEYPEKFKRVVVMNTFLPKGKPLTPFFVIWQKFAKYPPSLPVDSLIQRGTYNKLSKEVLAAYTAPFPRRK